MAWVVRVIAVGIVTLAGSLGRDMVPSRYIYQMTPWTEPIDSEPVLMKQTSACIQTQRAV